MRIVHPDQPSVDLVRDNPKIILYSDVDDGLQLFRGEHRSSGVTWRVDQYHPSLVCDRGSDGIDIRMKIFLVNRYVHRNCSDEIQHRLVRGPGGRQQNGLVTGHCGDEERVQKRLLGTGSDDNVVCTYLNRVMLR